METIEQYEIKIKKRIHEAIAEIIKKQNLSNNKLAELMKVNVGTISNYRTMKNVPSVGFIILFSELFNYNYEWLFLGKGNKYLSTELIKEKTSEYQTFKNLIKKELKQEIKKELKNEMGESTAKDSTVTDVKNGTDI